MESKLSLYTHFLRERLIYLTVAVYFRPVISSSSSGSNRLITVSSIISIIVVRKLILYPQILPVYVYND